MSRNGTVIADSAWGRTSARTLLKWFLLNPGESFDAAELCEVLWPGRDGAGRVNELHVTLHRLRRVLEPGLSGRRPSRFIRTGAGRYRFDPLDRWRTDLDEVQRLWRSARASGGETAIPFLHRLLEHYDHGFLPEELYTDSFAAFRDAHDRGHDEALHALLGRYRDLGRHFEVLTCAQRILDRDPYSECAVTALVETHLEQGNLAAAVAELNVFLRTRRDDLGIPPGRQLLALRERVRRTS